MFKLVRNILFEIANESSTIKKKKIIENNINNKLFRKVVLFTLDPYLRFNISKIEYIENINTLEVINDDLIFSQLEYLSQKRGATKKDKQNLSLICSMMGEDCVYIVNLILKKDLRCGASTKLFKLFMPELPEFGLMLCEDKEKHFLRYAGNKAENIIWSPKLDGVRTIARANIRENKVNYLSRKGLEFDFHILDEYILKFANTFREIYGGDEIINFDGEVITSEKKFQKLMTQLKRLKNVNKENFQFHIFDIVLENVILYERLKILENVFLNFRHNKNKIFFVPHYEIKDLSEMGDAFNKCIEYNFEGTVFKVKNSLYLFKRCHYWYKKKATKSVDVPIVGYYDGKGRNKGKMGGIIVELESGIRVNVGSGFNDEDRDVGYEKRFPIGVLAEVEFQEYTDKGSLRNPIFIRLRLDK